MTEVNDEDKKINDWIGEAMFLRQASKELTEKFDKSQETVASLRKQVDEQGRYISNILGVDDNDGPKKVRESLTYQEEVNDLADRKELASSVWEGETAPANGYVLLQEGNETCVYDTLDELTTDQIGGFNANRFNSSVYELGRRLMPVSKIVWKEVE